MDPPGPVPEMPGLSPVKGCVPENGFTAVAQAEAGPPQVSHKKIRDVHVVGVGYTILWLCTS